MGYSLSEWIKSVNSLLRRFIGIGIGPCFTIVTLLAIAGTAVGVAFPKFEATALLQFPEAQKAEPKGETRPTMDMRVQDPKSNVVELAGYKRVAAGYESSVQLAAYFDAVGLTAQPAAATLLRQADNPDFWSKVAAPVLPFSRRDQKEFGDIKDASATSILGLELTADARTESLASEMVRALAGFYVNAVMRERVRTWVISGQLESQSQEKAVRADILRAELDIELYGRRAEDMKAILARYPDSAKMDGRQVVAINPSEGGERYLSPLAQLVGAESAISQRREMIRRWQREVSQKEILARFYGSAGSFIDREIDTRKLISDLRSFAGKTFSHEQSAMEWNRESALRINAALDNFEVMFGQFGVRNGIRVGEVPSRSPWRLAGLGFVLGLVLLGAAAFFRAAMLSTVREPAVMDGNSRQN